MGLYKHILVGLDLTEDSKAILSKAEQLADTHGAKISLMHIIEPLAFAYAGDLPIDLTDTQQLVRQHAEKSLTDHAAQLKIKPENCLVVVGPTAAELRQQASDINADLIVVGSHGRHGFALLLGSTASDVLHGAKCDVLAIRV